MNASKSLKFSCPSCDQHLDAPEEIFGDDVECPNCGKPISVPVPETPEEAPEPRGTMRLGPGASEAGAEAGEVAEPVSDPGTTGSTSNSGGVVSIWNPKHASSWSVLTLGVLGPLIHGLNWRTMGFPAEASRSAVWAGIQILVVIAIILIPMIFPAASGALMSSVALGAIVAWYYLLGRKQQNYVAGLGKDEVSYRPILPVAAGAIVASLVLFVGVAMTNSAGQRMMLEKEAVPLVTDILRENMEGFWGSFRGSAPECVEVRLGEEITDGLYRGSAILDTGDDIDITVRAADHEIVVRVPLNQ